MNLPLADGMPDMVPPAESRRSHQDRRREAEACEFIINLVYERSRVRLHEGKHALIRARLGKRIRHHQAACLADYCDELRRTGDEREITHVIDALTTNFTSFLREEDHFRFLVETALPPRLGKRPHRFHLWSAACATGEEPYSLAFYLDTHFPLAEGWDWHILATDISTRVLEHTRAGIYASDRIAGLPQEWIRKYFQRGVDNSAGYFRVKPSIRDRLSVRQVNLLELPTMADSFEAVLCRNVMIYFDRKTQQQLVYGLARNIASNGYLLIGHSESLVGLPIPFRCLRPSYYQKR